MTETQEFKAWLRKNNNHLRAYTPDEIAKLGLACGFPLEVICPGVCDHVSHLKRLLAFWENDTLAEKWMRLVSLERGIEEAA